MSATRSWLSCLLALATVGCGYTSKYVPINDGRARAVWKDDNVVVELSGAPMTPACRAVVQQTTQTGKLRLSDASREALRAQSGPTAGVAYGGPSVYWVPRYYGPRIVVVTPGLAPRLPMPPLFLPRPSLTPPGMPRPPGVHAGSSPGIRLGNDAGKALAVLAIVALIVLPALDLGLAIADPESSERSSQAIDQVNVINDLARSPGCPCSPEMNGAGS